MSQRDAHLTAFNPLPGEVLPLDGESGQTIRVDPITGLPLYVPPVTSLGFTEVSILDTTVTSFYVQQIEGDLLGANGFLRLTVLGHISNVSGANRKITWTIDVTDSLGNVSTMTLDSANFPTANSGAVKGTFLLANQADATNQTCLLELVLSKVDYTILPTMTDYSNVATVDTRLPWTVELSAALSAAGTNTLDLYQVLAEIITIP